MRLANVERASKLIDEVLSDTGEDNFVYLSAMVPPKHKELIVGLARLNRTKQANVLRAIINEWCEHQINSIDCEPPNLPLPQLS